ncbi:MAG: hypothetical protein ACHQX3_06320 [Nitrospirales bacterium]
MSEKKDVVPAPKHELADWQKQLADMAITTAEQEKPSGSWVSFKAGVLSFAGNPIKGNKMKVVVVHSAHENQLYATKDEKGELVGLRYDADNPATPVCYAIAENEEDLKPHPDSLWPQSESCTGCPRNEWKSDFEGGNGKACKNVRRLAMIAFDDMGSIPKAQVAMAKLPVTSVKNWSTYANQIANVLKLPPLAVITEMSVEPNAKTVFQINFDLVDKISDGAQIQALLSKRKDTTPLIFAGYDKPTEPKQATPAAATKY